MGTLATVKHVLAYVLECERYVVRAPCRWLRYTGVNDRADEDRVIPAGHRLDQRALDVTRSLFKNLGAGAAGAERLAADGLPLRRDRLEEGVSCRLLRLTQHVEGEPQRP